MFRKILPLILLTLGLCYSYAQQLSPLTDTLTIPTFDTRTKVPTNRELVAICKLANASQQSSRGRLSFAKVHVFNSELASVSNNQLSLAQGDYIITLIAKNRSGRAPTLLNIADQMGSFNYNVTSRPRLHFVTREYSQRQTGGLATLSINVDSQRSNLASAYLLLHTTNFDTLNPTFAGDTVDYYKNLLLQPNLPVTIEGNHFGDDPHVFFSISGYPTVEGVNTKVSRTVIPFAPDRFTITTTTPNLNAPRTGIPVPLKITVKDLDTNKENSFTAFYLQT